MFVSKILSVPQKCKKVTIIESMMLHSATRDTCLCHWMFWLITYPLLIKPHENWIISFLAFCILIKFIFEGQRIWIKWQNVDFLHVCLVI